MQKPILLVCIGVGAIVDSDVPDGTKMICNRRDKVIL